MRCSSSSVTARSREPESPLSDMTSPEGEWLRDASALGAIATDTLPVSTLAAGIPQGDVGSHDVAMRSAQRVPRFQEDLLSYRAASRHHCGGAGAQHVRITRACTRAAITDNR